MVIIDETQFLMQITIKDMQKLQQIFLKEPIPEEVYYYTVNITFTPPPKSKTKGGAEKKRNV